MQSTNHPHRLEVNTTIRLKEFDLRKGYRPTTYGMLKGARHFFLLASGADGESALSTGFRFEQIVLKAWQMGLGTCWIAATFKGSDFDRDQTWPEGETLRIVCPVGTAAPPTATERLTRLALRSANLAPVRPVVLSHRLPHPASQRQPFCRTARNASARTIIHQLPAMAGTRLRQPHRPLLLSSQERYLAHRLRHRLLPFP